MKRSTNRNDIAVTIIKAIENALVIRQISLKLKDYEDLEEQGLLIELPCKVGDSVYFIMKEFDIAKESWKRNIDEYIVTEIRGNKYNPLWFMASSEKCTHIDFHPTQIGKTVFLTREEAEKALLKEDK